MHRFPRRRLLLVPILGFVTTVAVAWTGAVVEQTFRVTSSSETLVFEKHAAEVEITRGRVVSRIGVTWMPNDFVSRPSVTRIDALHHADQSQVPAWSAAWLRDRPTRPLSSWDGGHGQAAYQELASGWPFRAFFVTSNDDPTMDGVDRIAVYPPSVGGITLRCHVIQDGATFFEYRAIPYTPIPLGLAADTAIYSVLWSPVLLYVPIRTARRRRRGLCTSCGYDRRHHAPDAVCPECGVKPI